MKEPSLPVTSVDIKLCQEAILQNTKKAQHDRVTFDCDQCAYKSSRRSMLFGHIKAVHEHEG